MELVLLEAICKEWVLGTQRYAEKRKKREQKEVEEPEE
jgi:hypothetical protein